MDTTMKYDRVAVLGLGLTGVSTLKNLREAGLDAVGFDRNNYVGGLWKWSKDTKQTTVLKSTVTNVSKQKSCYQDFPFPDEVSNYPTADEVADYIQAYVDHFRLSPHCRLGTSIKSVERSANGLQWVLRISDDKGERTELFDRVVVTTGTFQRPFTPRYKGMETFKGRILHSQAFKEPRDFTEQTVIVVGMSNTAGDVAVDLSKTAKTVYISHRSGARIGSRNRDNPLDHRATRRLTAVGLTMNEKVPRLAGKLAAFFLESKMKRDHKLRPEWNLLPAPPIFNAPPMMNDHIMSCLSNDAVFSLPGIKRFEEDYIVFTDNTKIQADAVIFCTGYSFDYGVLAPEANPCTWSTPEWDKSPHMNGLEYPQLYQGIFSPEYSDSLAFIGPCRGHSIAAFNNADLSSQAISQVWTGGYALPSRADMQAWCDNNYKKSLSQLKVWHIQKVGSSPKELERWLNEAAGNGMNEMLGWSWKAWKFWLSDRKLYGLLMDGVDTPFAYRLFDGRRKKWDGARDAIMKANKVKETI